MSGISIVEPLKLTDDNFISSNVPENDYPVWSSSATYALGDRVILTSTHKVYESLQDGNKSNDPITQAAFWSPVRATNRWAAFDTSNSTKTVTAGGDSPSIIYEIAASSIDSVAILNISNASSVKVTLTSSASIVYSKDISLLGIPFSSDWWSWFFGDRTLRPTQVVLVDLPMYANAVLKIEIYGSVELSVGVILVGRSKKIGRGVLSGVNVGIQDYSRKEKNEYGDTTLVERAFAKRANFRVLIESSEVDSTISYMSNVRAKPCLWIGGSYESLVVYGFYKSFEVLIQYLTHSEFSLELEGLT